MTPDLRPDGSRGGTRLPRLYKGVSGRARPFSLLRAGSVRHVRVRVCAFACSCTMGFGDLKSTAGLQVLNDYLADKSYIEG